MSQEKELIITVGGEEVYRGNDFRDVMPHLQIQEKEQKFLGLTFSDGIKLVFYLICIIAFFIKSDARISKIEESVQLLSGDNTLFRKYMSNSDNYHSSATRRAFELGRPIDGGYTSGYKRNDKDNDSFN